MPYISKNTITKLKEEVSLLTVIKHFVELKKAGATWKGLSPFTEEKTPSFMVNEAKGVWKCFASGKGGNNAIQFVMALPLGLTYTEAIEKVAALSSISVNYEDSKEAEKYIKQQQQKDELRPLLQATINVYHKKFIELPEDHPAKKEVFGKRQYTMQEVEDYQIGYAPDDKSIYNKVVELGRKEDALAIGLINDYNDTFRNRVIYPIYINKGRTLLPVGLAGRDLTEKKEAPKWLNSKESLLYSKDKVWYGLDKAQESIVKLNRVFLVEGYNDVIAFQTHGLLNTVAGCGTAITNAQIKILKRFCETVVFCMDNDGSGLRSMLKYVQEFLKEGFRTEVLILKEGDPDEYVRLKKQENKSFTLESLQTDKSLIQDGFKFLLENDITNKSEVEKATNAQRICELIAQIEDKALVTIYSKWLAKESGIILNEIKAWIKEVEQTQQIDIPTSADEYYQLPKTIKEPLEKLRPIIEKYQLFMANNQIWMQTGNEPPFKFTSVSNFSIDIIQHMNDEKFPMKLIRIKNIFGDEKIFDVPSEAMNTPMAFDNAVTAHGNFFWRGGRNEHQKLRAYLFDQMGTGRKIETLGWQPEGFWCWNNEVTIPGKSSLSIDDNGVFKYNNTSYYIPSANKIYSSNAFKYEAQKRVQVISPKISFYTLVEQVIKVHRNHGITAILFSIASMFQDIVVNKNGNFPMLFLYGPASSGKDQLAEICQSFFGAPQTAINLEGGVSTQKAQIREFAQFSNMISHLSEYKTGDAKMDGILKGLWDRRGYKRGNIDSHVGSESIPILSSTIMTGNYTPDAEALITRLIWEEMVKTQFTDQEIDEYDKLVDMVKGGISGFTSEIIQYRYMVEQNFTRVFREMKATLGEKMPDVKSRMISNASVLCSFYHMFQNTLVFPFSIAQVIDHLQKGIETQSRKLATASIVNRWWDCFLASLRGTMADQLRVGRDFKLEGTRLYFNYTNSYNKIQRQWYQQFKDTAPGKTVMKDALIKERAYIEDVKAVRMAQGKNSTNTSACVFDINLLDIAEELKFAVEFQMNENTLFEKQTPATPFTEDDNDIFEDFF